MCASAALDRDAQEEPHELLVPFLTHPAPLVSPFLLLPILLPQAGKKKTKKSLKLQVSVGVQMRKQKIFHQSPFTHVLTHTERFYGTEKFLGPPPRAAKCPPVSDVNVKPICWGEMLHH